MTKHAKLVATYRINEYELLQMSVSLASSYPDALDEAKATALDGIHRMLLDVYGVTERVPVTPDATLPGPTL